MSRILLATASVHTTAAACDYLSQVAGPDDEVFVLTVDDGAVTERDRGDARNVARTRLVEPAVETMVGAGDPTAAIQSVASEHEVDLLVVGSRRGDPGVAGEPPGTTVSRLLRESEQPVVVVDPGVS